VSIGRLRRSDLAPFCRQWPVVLLLGLSLVSLVLGVWLAAVYAFQEWLEEIVDLWRIDG